MFGCSRRTTATTTTTHPTHPTKHHHETPLMRRQQTKTNKTDHMLPPYFEMEQLRMKDRKRNQSSYTCVGEDKLQTSSLDRPHPRNAKQTPNRVKQHLPDNNDTTDAMTMRNHHTNSPNQRNTEQYQWITEYGHMLARTLVWTKTNVKFPFPPPPLPHPRNAQTCRSIARNMSHAMMQPTQWPHNRRYSDNTTTTQQRHGRSVGRPHVQE